MQLFSTLNKAKVLSVICDLYPGYFIRTRKHSTK